MTDNVFQWNLKKVILSPSPLPSKHGSELLKPNHQPPLNYSRKCPSIIRFPWQWTRSLCILNIFLPHNSHANICQHKLASIQSSCCYSPQLQMGLLTNSILFICQPVTQLQASVRQEVFSNDILKRISNRIQVEQMRLIWTVPSSACHLA